VRCPHRFSADFTWDNQETATAVDDGDGISLRDPAHTGLDARVLYRAAPATPYTIDAFWRCSSFLKDFLSFGIGFRNGTNGAFHVMTWRSQTGVIQLYEQKYDTPTAFASGGQIKTIPSWSHGHMRMADDGASIKWHYSLDGDNWNLIKSASRTGFLAALDGVCSYFQGRNNVSGDDDMVIKIFDWTVG